MPATHLLLALRSATRTLHVCCLHTILNTVNLAVAESHVGSLQTPSCLQDSTCGHVVKTRVNCGCLQRCCTELCSSQ